MSVDDATILAALAADEPSLEERNCAAAFRQQAARLIRARMSAEAGARDLLAALADLALPVAVIGNGYSTTVHAACEELGFRGVVLPSEDVGARLPSPSAFAAITSALRLPADRIWFISKDRAELDAARSLGFETIFVAHDQSLTEALEPLREPYTQSLLALRYMMRTALEWRPGHVIVPQGAE
jgi:FMN phosphatase YigB (HAD superfamily)